MEFSEVVRSRQSVKQFDKNYRIPEHELKEILNEVILSPSSFNLQHWRFVVVIDQEIKDQLCKASWNQTQVADCSACIIVIGKLDAHATASETLKNEPANVREMFLPMIHQFYSGKEQLIRDEAIRSSSLAAMTLMFASKNKGYDTCPMIGFDAKKVSEIIGLSATDLPVMMVVLGKAIGERRARSTRIPIDQCVYLNRMEGRSL